VIRFVLIALGCCFCLASVIDAVAAESGPPVPDEPYGWCFDNDEASSVHLWWTLSGWKVGRDWPRPKPRDATMRLAAARNETESVQLVIRSDRALQQVRADVSDLMHESSGAVLAAKQVTVLRAVYVNVTQSTDHAWPTGWWPDPLPAWREPINLEADVNHILWLRVDVPRDAAAGVYRGQVRLRGTDYEAEVPLELEVFDFALPDRTSCVTAFGFSPQEVFRYQRLRDEAQQRTVLEKYWQTFADYRISPYDPAPLDPIGVRWPDVEPPPALPDRWPGGRVVYNEAHRRGGSLAVFDDRRDATVIVTYFKPLPLREQGLQFSFAYRTALPGHRFSLSLSWRDKDNQWIGNHDLWLTGDGTWQQYEHGVEQFPENAVAMTLNLQGARWTDQGEQTGLVWYDDISVIDRATGRELIENGSFEPESRPMEAMTVEQREQLKAELDFSRWDEAMRRAMEEYHFNSFVARIPGLGGGTFHAVRQPELRGFTEDMPQYWALLESYAGQLQAHLAQRGWLDRAFVYWFDEPAPDQYDFVKRGFDRLRRVAPKLRGIITIGDGFPEQLLGGPHIWCPGTNYLDVDKAQQRRDAGESIWWYICTGPKAPYAGLFIDRPATDLRVWLWQTFQYDVQGILIWATNYWNSGTAYPDRRRPQNPYEDPMSWMVGYGTVDVRVPWGNGDGRFFYPPLAAADGRPGEPVLEGPVVSIRLEALRDGLEDYEYLVMLRDLLADADLGDEQRREYEALLIVPDAISENMRQFTKSPLPIEEHRRAVARAIERLRQ